MKKLLVVLLALTVIGVYVFADDAAAAPAPKISVEVNDGVIYSATSNGGTYKDYGIDYGSGFAGGTAVATIAEAGSNFGYSIGLAYKGSNAMNALDHAWAYVAPLSGLTVYAGISGNNAPFGDLDNNGAGAYSTSSLGAFYTVGGFSIGAQMQQMALIETVAAPVWLGLHYTMDKVFQANAYFTNDQTTGLDQARISASLAAVPNLTLTAGFNGTSLNSSSAENAFIDVQAGYQIMPALGVGVIVYNRNELNTSVNGDNYTAYQVNASYTINPQFALGAYFAGTTASNSDMQPEGQLVWTPVAGTTIKLTGWYDTSVQYNGNLAGTYSAAVGSGTGGLFSGAIDVKFAY